MSLEQLLASIPPGSSDETLARQVNFEQLPAHVAIIMDGNGRWAAQRHLPRVEGHRAGIDSVRDVVETSARLGIEVLTLYAFSVENWKRPRAEVNTLMMLLKRYIRLELSTLLKNDIRFRVIGRPDELSPDVQHELEIGIRRTAGNRGMLFNIALNYGGRAEIVDAARRAIAAGIPADDLDERRFSELLYTAGPARSRSADPHERRDARQQLPPLADRVLRDLGHRDAVARLPPPRSARSRPRLPEARPPLRRHQAVAGGARRKVNSRRSSVVSRRSSDRQSSVARGTQTVTRVLSGAVLIAIAVAVVWFAHPLAVSGRRRAAARARVRRVRAARRGQRAADSGRPGLRRHDPDQPGGRPYAAASATAWWRRRRPRRGADVGVRRPGGDDAAGVERRSRCARARRRRHLSDAVSRPADRRDGRDPRGCADRRRCSC